MPKDYSGLDLRERDLRGEDIRGCCFKDKDLTGADLRGAKINGANFCGANLTNAKLDKAICGLKTYWAICVLIMSLLVGSLSGFSASILLNFNFYFFSGSRKNRNFIIFCIATIYITILHSFIVIKIDFLNANYLIIFATIIIVIVGLIIPLVVLINKPKTQTNLSHLNVVLFSLLIIMTSFCLQLVINSLKNDIMTVSLGDDIKFVISKANVEILNRFIGAFLGAFLGIWISHIAIKYKDQKFIWSWEIFVNIASMQGTKFDYSNLSNASFKGANLRGSYFVSNIINRTDWGEVKQIDCSTIQENYLEKSKIKNLVIKPELIRDKNYRGMTLKELNLDNAILNEFDLSEADLSDSTLKNAKLIDSNLSKTRLDNVDLRGANITGATIELKSIPHTAKLDRLICKYFYSTSNPKERYPVTGEFASSEAIEFLQELSKFILIFEREDGIDWQAFLQAFNNCLREFDISPDNSKKIIKSIEVISDDNFAIQLNIPDNVDEINFGQKLKQEYKKVSKDLKREYPNAYQRSSDELRDNTSILKIIELLAQIKSIHIGDINNKVAGDNIQQQGSFGVGVNKGKIEAEEIAGTINEAQQKNIAEAVAEIQALLKQLEKSCPTDTTAGKMALATEAIQRIDSNPNLTARILSALQVGSVKAFEQSLNNPAASFVIGALEDWQKTKRS